MSIALDTKGLYTARTGSVCHLCCVLRGLVVASTPPGGPHVFTPLICFSILLQVFCAFSDCHWGAPICFS